MEENLVYLIKFCGKNPESIDKFAKVSFNKKNIIEHYKWYLGKDGYPFTFIKGSRIPLHRYIWYVNTGLWSNKYYNNGQIKKLYIDHINRNKLDATDENLRLATPAENSYNKTCRICKSTIIDPINNQPLHHIKLKKLGYEVCLNKDGITNKINKITTLVEAKEIYNLMATEMFGSYAVLYN
jgi:hypothetical protein